MTEKGLTLEQLIRSAIDVRLAQVRVCLPGQVVNYDPTTQTAEIQPTIDSAIATGDGVLTEKLSSIPGVPVCFAAGGGFAVMVPLQPGDPGTLIFNDFSLDVWRLSTPAVPPTTFPPQDTRVHDLSAAEFWPGKHPDTKALVGASATDLVVALNGVAVIDIDPTGAIAIGASAVAAVARKDDPVKVTIPASSFLISCSGSPALGVLNPAPIDITGTITAGSAKVTVA
jgi:hypothetical protein